MPRTRDPDPSNAATTTTLVALALVGLCWLTPVAIAAPEATTPPAAEQAPNAQPTRRTGPVLVDAMRPADLPEDPAAFTTVIEMDEFAGEAKSVEEVLNETVGVQVRRFGGPGDPAEISIRGSTANQVVVLLDGVRLNNAQTGGVDLSTLPAKLIERIEVSRGGGSVQTGSDAIGGVVNIISRRVDGAPVTTASFTAESFGTYRGSATHRRSWRDTEFVLGYSGFSTDGDWEFQPVRREGGGGAVDAESGPFTRVNNQSEAHSVLLAVARDLGDWGRLSLRDSFLYDSSGRPGPDALAFGELQGQSLTAHQRRTRNVASVVLELADVFDTAVGGSLQVFHRYDRSRFEDPSPPFLEAIDSDNRNQGTGTRLNVTGDWTLGPTAHALSAGSEFRWDILHAKYAPDRKRRTLGLFLQDEISAWERRVRVIPALRVDATQGFDVEWLPRLGVILRVFSWLELKGNVERSYRVPNFDELYFDEGAIRGNPNLAPEEAFNADVGFRVGLDAWGPVGDAWLEAAYFYNDIDDSILFQVINNGVVAATNTGAARIDGVELAGGIRFFGWVGFTANWTYLDSEVVATGAPLPGRAASEYLLRLEIGPPNRLVRLVGERLFTSSIPVTSSGRTRIADSRAIYGASIALDVAQLPWLGERIPGRELLLSFAVKNLTDRSVRDALFFPQPGRTLAFSVDWEI